MEKKSRVFQSVLNAIIFAIILILVNISAQYVYTDFDLTEEGRYTLTEHTVELVENVDDIIYVEVLLDGKFPAGFKRLKQSAREMLEEFRDINSNIEFRFIDPAEGSNQEIKATQEKLVEQGIIPVALTYFDGSEMVNKAIFPHAIFNLGSRKVIVNMLEEQQPGENEDIVLNNSVALLEYKFANALHKLYLKTIPNVVFTAGQGEATQGATYRLETELRKFYNTGRVNLDSVTHLDKAIDVLIVAGPKKTFDQKDLFKIDQYVMNGGKILWLIDKFDVDEDSIARYKFYIPQDYPLGIDDLMFKYGVRIQPNFINDMESSSIPQVIGMQGERPQTRLFKWVYHPLIAPRSNHPIVKNLDRISMTFPSTIDTVQTATKINKTTLLASSQYSKVQLNPVRLNFEILKYELDASKFNQPYQPVAILLEGSFQSYFKNRLGENFRATLNEINQPFKEESPPTKQIVISDSDFALNLSNNQGETREIGYNKWEQRTYRGNKPFVLNSIEFLLDGGSNLNSRSKEIKLRLLDAVKTKEERLKWQIINIILPLLFLAIFGVVFNVLRRRKYSKVAENKD